MQTTDVSRNWQIFYDSDRHNDVLDARTRSDPSSLSERKGR